MPAGGLAFFKGGSQGFGHVMISLGGGSFASTDVGTDGRYHAGRYGKTTIATDRVQLRRDLPRLDPAVVQPLSGGSFHVHAIAHQLSGLDAGPARGRRRRGGCHRGARLGGRARRRLRQRRVLLLLQQQRGRDRSPTSPDSLDDYGTTQPSCYEFKGAGNGKGMCVKNNAASVWNRTSKTVRVYFNSNFAGAHQDFAAGAKGNLNATLKNQNASHELLCGATADRAARPTARTANCRPASSSTG